MLKKTGNLLFFCLVTAFFSASAFAWSDVGHKITGYIAWQRMSPEARENVIRILRAAPEDSHLAAYYQVYGVRSDVEKQLEYFMLVPTWADIVRDRSFQNRFAKYHKGDWHYTSVFWRQVNGRAELVQNKAADGQAVIKLNEFDKALRDSSVSDAEKAIALAWFLHLGGDIHQPLHTSSRITELEPNGDLGANLVLLSPQGTPRDEQLNLHWFWDSIVERNMPFDGGLCESEYVRRIADAMIARYSFEEAKPRLDLSNYETWQKESFELAVTDAFRSDLIRFQTPGDDYRRNAYRVSEQRLTLSGYRMGETLNDIFGKK